MKCPMICRRHLIPLEESEREKGLMIAQLSHDIKTPITSIQATVEGILDGVIKEGEQDHYLANHWAPD